MNQLPKLPLLNIDFADHSGSNKQDTNNNEVSGNTVNQLEDKGSRKLIISNIIKLFSGVIHFSGLG